MGSVQTPAQTHDFYTSQLQNYAGNFIGDYAAAPNSCVASFQCCCFLNVKVSAPNTAPPVTQCCLCEAHAVFRALCCSIRRCSAPTVLQFKRIFRTQSKTREQHFARSRFINLRALCCRPIIRSSASPPMPVRRHSFAARRRFTLCPSPSFLHQLHLCSINNRSSNSTLDLWPFIRWRAAWAATQFSTRLVLSRNQLALFFHLGHR